VAIHYVHDRVQDRLITTAEGLVTFDDLTAHLDMEEHNRDLGRAELIDARTATTNVTASQVRRLAQRAADMLARAPLGPTAVVTTNDVAFGMARMYSVFAGSAGAIVEVFRDVEAAKAWLEHVSPDHGLSGSLPRE